MDKKQNKKEYITLQEATKYCDYSQEYLSLRARQGKLMAVKFKRNWLIKKEWLKEYLKQPSNYISLKQAAEYCDYSHDYLSLRARQGKLKAVKLVNNWMTKKKWLDRYLKKHQKKVKQKVIKTEVVKILPPPDNLPIEEFQPGVKVFRSISITRMLRTGVVSVLIAGLLISGALAGKGFFSNTLMPHLAQTHRVIGKFLNRSVLPIIEDSPRLRNVLFGLAAAGESVGDLLTAYFSWFGNSFKSISQKITKTYFAFHNFLNENTKQGFRAIKNSVFSFFNAVGNFFADISQGKRISLFSKEKLLTEEVFIKTEERLTEKLIKAFQQGFDKLAREGIPSKQIITEIQPIKEITTEVRTIDSAALVQLRSDIQYVQAELANRLYAPGGVITQQIYVTEPIQSPKIYQEDGDIVLQTIGSGNIILSAATGLQLHGSQVVIDSTSILNPLIYLADATRIDGSLTANGPITAQRITLNAPADFVGKILDVQSAGASKFSVDNDGTALLVGDFTITGDLSIIGNQSLDGTFTISASSSSSILTVTQTGNGKIFNFTSTADSTQNLGTITGITTNALLALYQQGTGSVLIATTTSSSTNPAIKITNLGTGDSFVIESQDTDSSPFVIDSSGNVGISTSSPLYTLQIWGNTFIGTSTTPTLFVDTGTQRIGIGTSTPAQALHIIGNILGSGNAVFEGVLDVQGYTTSTFAGPVQITTTTQPQLVIAYSSTTYSTFSVSSNGSTALVSTNSFNLTGAGSSIWQTTNYGSLTIQSASSTEIVSGDTLTASSTNEMIFAINGQERVRIDTNGYVGIATTTPSEALTIVGNILGMGNITVSGNIMPTSPRTQDIGSDDYDWQNIYVDAVYANNINAASSTIAGTSAGTFTINSDAAADATSSLRFYRGTDTPHALLAWDAPYDRFNFNFPLYLSGTGTITSASSLTASSTNETLFATAGQERMRIDTTGNVGIATSTPSSLFSVGSGTGFQVNNAGTVLTGTWEGDEIADTYIADDITASNYLSLTTWYSTTTDGLDEGSTNKYYSTQLFAADLAGTTTDALTEGTTNLYFSTTTVDYWGSQRAGTAIDWSTGFNLDATGNWTGTLDGWEGAELVFSTTTNDYWFDNTSGITGNANIVTVGTIGTGTWEGDEIADTYIADDITASNYLSLTTWYSTTTDGLDEGSTNKYYSTQLFAADLAGTTTDALAEGSSNIYFTDERTDDRVNALIQNGTNLTWTYNDTSNTLTGNVTDAWWNSLSDMSLTQGNIYVGDSSDNPTATSSIFIDTAGNVGIGTTSPTTGKLVVNNGSVDIASFDGSTIGLKLAGNLITANAAEINYLDGVTGVGIANDNLMLVDDTDAADNDYAKFTANGLEGRNYKEVLDDLSGNYLTLTTGLSGEPYLRASQLNNLFYAADKRFTITKTGTTTAYTPSDLFNNDYEDIPVKTTDGNTVTLNFNLTDKGEYSSLTYSYGKIVVHFYYIYNTESVRARVKTKNAGETYEWRDWVNGVDISRSGSYHVMVMDMQGNYHCTEVEVEITASGNDVWLSEIEWNMDRAIDGRIFPLVQKYNNNNLYGNLYFKNSVNTQVASITSAGEAYFGGNVGIGDTTPDSILDIATSGVDPILTITSASTTADYDPTIAFQTRGENTRFKLYVDDSDSDKFKIATSTADVLTIDQSGNLQMEGDLTVDGNDIVFGNGERIDNNSDGYLVLTATYTKLTGQIVWAGNGTLNAYSSSADTTVNILNSHANYVANLAVEGDLTVSGSATTTDLYTTQLGINSEYFTDLTGTGLQNSAGILTLNTTGDWTGTLDGYEAIDLLDNTDTQLNEEQVQDFAFTNSLGGTETHISVTYQDATNDIDFVVSDDWYNSVADFSTTLTDTYWCRYNTAGTEINCDVVPFSDSNLTEEEVEDFVGGMLGGTETLISVTYQDETNDIDFVVDNNLHNYSWANVVDADITDTLTAKNIKATDDRDYKPNTDASWRMLRTYFTSLGGMTGAADSDYQDLVILNTYSDGSGGDINALTFDKSTQLIKHWLADQTAATWGTPKTIAYIDSTMTGTWAGNSIANAYIDDDITASNYLSLTTWYSTTTDQLTEGGTNLYYTDARVSTYLTGGTGITESAGTISFDCSEVEGTGINCSGEAITLDTTTNMDTATALAANGANCASGQAPLGVNALGAVEGCFDVSTGGSNWQFLTVNAITPTSTVGIILNASSTINHNLTVGTSTALYVDSGNGRVGIGTTGPDRKLDILDSTNPQLRITQADGSTYADFKVDSAGDLIIAAQGGDIRALDENLWICAEGACPSFGLTGNGNLGVEGDIELAGQITMGPHYNGTERSTYSTSMVKLKETRIGFGGSGLKVIIQIKILNNASGMTVSLYINGVSVAGILSGTLAASDTYYEFEISPSVEFEANDDIQIWGRTWTGGVNWTLFVRNFQVWGTMDFVNKL